MAGTFSVVIGVRQRWAAPALADAFRPLGENRNIGAGSIIGSATVSNRDSDAGPGKPIDQGRPGLFLHSRRSGRSETILEGKAKTEFLKRGDAVRIRMDDEAGNPIFG